MPRCIGAALGLLCGLVLFGWPGAEARPASSGEDLTRVVTVDHSGRVRLTDVAGAAGPTGPVPAATCPTDKGNLDTWYPVSCAGSSCSAPVTWTAPSDAPAGTVYEVLVSYATGGYCTGFGGTKSVVGTTTGTSFTLTGIPLNMSYIVAVRVQGCQDYVGGFQGYEDTFLTPTQNPVLSGTATTSSATLRFVAPDDLAFYHWPQRSTDGANFSDLPITTSNFSSFCPIGVTATYTDDGLAPGTYWYRIYTGSNYSGGGGYSNVVQLTIGSCTPPATPTVYTVSSVSPNQTGLTASVASHSGSTYNWTVTNGTLTSGQGTPAIVFTAGASGSIGLSVTETNGGCTSAAGTATILIQCTPPATPTVNTVSSASPSQTGLTASVAYHSGSTYYWTVTNGTLTSGQGTEAIVFTAGASGSVGLSVTETNGGCTSVEGTATIRITCTPPAAPTVYAVSSANPNQTGLTANVAYHSGSTYSWTVTNGTLTSGQGTNAIVFTAGASGSVGLSVTEMNGGCTSAAGTTTILIKCTTPATPTVYAVSSANPNQTGLTANVAYHSGSTYSWTVTNGTLTSGQGTNAIVFTAGASGSVGLSVTEMNGGCTSAAGTTTILIKCTTPATPTVYAVSSANPNQTGLTANVAYHAGSTYNWTVTNGTLTSGQGTETIVFTAGASGSVGLSVTETNGGCTSVEGTATIPITCTPPAAPTVYAVSSVKANQTGLTANVAYHSGSTYNWTVTNGTLTSGQGTNAIVFTAGASGTISLSVTETNGGCTSAAGTASIPIDSCVAPGAPVNLSILPKNPAFAGAPPTATDTLILSWAAGPEQAPVRYQYRLNADAWTSTTATSVEVGQRKSATPIQLNVQAFACSPELGSPVGTSATAALAKPVADFSMPATAGLNVPVTLTDTSNPQATSWLWIYADGTRDTNQSQSHSFTASGAQQVALIASNGSGTDVKVKSITIAAGVVTPSTSENVRRFDATDGGRHLLEGVKIDEAERTWLHVTSRSAEPAVIYLHFVDETGATLLERRLALEPYTSGKYDLAAYGLKGKYRLEAVSTSAIVAWVAEEGDPEAGKVVKRR